MLGLGKGTPRILTRTKGCSARILRSGNDSCLLGGLRSWLIFGFINEHFGLELNFMTFALLASELVWLHKHLLVGKALADLMLEVDGNGDGFIDFKAGWIWRVHTFVDGCTLTCQRWCKLSLLNRVQSLLFEPITSSKAWYQEFLAMMRGQGGGKPVGSSNNSLLCIGQDWDKMTTKERILRRLRQTWVTLSVAPWWSHFLCKARLKQGRGKWKVGVFSRRTFQAVILQRFEFSTTYLLRTFGLKLLVWKLQPNTISFDGRFCVDYYPFNLEQRVWPRPNLRAT